MTIARARELLGVEAESMSDEGIKQLIEDFDIIAQYSIKEVQKFTIDDGNTD